MIDFIERLDEFVKTLPFGMIRYSVADREGNIESRDCMSVARCQDCYSVAKMYTSTAIGILYDRGMISPDDRICDILRDDLPAGMDGRWEKCTVDMCLRHEIGLPGSFLDIDAYSYGEFGKDFLGYMLTYPLDYTPGEGSKYTDGAYYLLARLVEKKVGRPMEDFLRDELFDPMNYGETAWSHCPMGHCMGATGLHIHSEDIAKLGVLYLRGGDYMGKRLISEEWCKRTLERGYSFVWDESCKFYYKGGMFGQIVAVFPEKDIAIGVQSFGADECDRSMSVAKWIRDNV